MLFTKILRNLIYTRRFINLQAHCWAGARLRNTGIYILRHETDKTYYIINFQLIGEIRMPTKQISRSLMKSEFFRRFMIKVGFIFSKYEISRIFYYESNKVMVSVIMHCCDILDILRDPGASPVGIWCQNDVVLMSTRRHHVTSTLIRRHFGTKCPLGSDDVASMLLRRHFGTKCPLDQLFQRINLVKKKC